MPRVQVANGLNVHYERIGTGPDLVMIHGIAGHLATWHFKIVPMLWDHFQILTYDLRGHGYTERTETGYTPTQLATDLKLLLDELGIERAHVVGHSFGADIALYFAYLYPNRVDRVVLIEPLVPAIVNILTRRDFRHADWAARLLGRLGVTVPKERRLDAQYLMQQVVELPNKWGPLKDMPKSEETKRSMINLFLTTSIAKDAIDIGDLTLENLEMVDVPVHLLYDSSSLMWHKSHTILSEKLPQVTSTILDSGADELSHLVPLEKPEIVAQEIFQALMARPVA